MPQGDAGLTMRRIRRGVALLMLLTGTACSASHADGPARPATARHARAPVVMFLGDSYTAGIHDTTVNATYAAYTARTLGWQVIVGGRSGTGFIAPGRIRQPFPVLFERQLAWRPPPDMLIVSGGHNDALWPPADVAAVARDLLVEIEARWPGTHLVLIGPLWGTGSPDPPVVTIRDALQQVARDLNIPFIDPLREQWITGDRRDGTGNAATYILGDRIHPTQQGHRYLADRLVADLRRLGLTRPVRRT